LRARIDDGVPSSTVDAIGFSTRTWMPRSMQRIAKSRCRWVGAAMVMASTPPDSRAVHLGVAGAVERTADELALLAIGIHNPGELDPRRSAKTRAWLLPITSILPGKTRADWTSGVLKQDRRPFSTGGMALYSAVKR